MEFRVPELGEGVYEAEFAEWKVKPGDVVKPGQTLAEIITDKAVMEIPAPFAGTISTLHADAGQQIKVGEVLLDYEAKAGAGGPASAHKTAATPPKSVKAAAAEKQPAARSGKKSSASTAAKATVSDRPHELEHDVVHFHDVAAAPSVRFMARKLGIDLTEVHGTGPGGRVLVEDLARHLPLDNGQERRGRRELTLDYGVAGTRIKFHGVRRQIAEHLVHSKRTIPHYTYIDECDVSELVKLRDSLQQHYQQSGVKLTYLAFFVKAVVAALKEIPIVNSSLDEQSGEIVLHDRYDIGIATATRQGLIVPVLRGADRKDLRQIAREIERLSSAARAGKSTLEDLRHGTFTITSIGGIGGLASTPVINHPEVAILGIGKVVKRPAYDEHDNLYPARLMFLSLSFDHRVVDGAVGAAFANVLIRVLQRPALLLVQ